MATAKAVEQLLIRRVRIAEAVFTRALQEDFSDVSERILVRAKPITQRELGELLEAIDRVHPSARGHALRAVSRGHHALAETLLLFSAQDGGPSKQARLEAAFLHLVINTDVAISVEGSIQEALNYATEYARAFGIDAIRREGYRILARVCGETVEIGRFNLSRPATELLRDIGRAINFFRFGCSTVIPQHAS
jgi:hypothetical protein